MRSLTEVDKSPTDVLSTLGKKQACAYLIFLVETFFF